MFRIFLYLAYICNKLLVEDYQSVVGAVIICLLIEYIVNQITLVRKLIADLHHLKDDNNE